ncbi:MAG: hypothetical protein P1R58_02030 [bacterium]|nr:hypothetical protein [bacterium]
MGETHQCVNCGRELVERNGVLLCLNCNSNDLDSTQPFHDDSIPHDSVFIECPGATLYEPGTNNVIGGVKFLDNEDPFRGWKIIGEPIFAPTHRRRRMIKKEALGRIRRCEGCQDYTVRMRRKEGPDFYIPSTKDPKRKKLKSVKHTYVEPC